MTDDKKPREFQVTRTKDNEQMGLTVLIESLEPGETKTFVEISAYEAVLRDYERTRLQFTKDWHKNQAEIARLEAQEKNYREQASQQALRGDQLSEALEQAKFHGNLIKEALEAEVARGNQNRFALEGDLYKQITTLIKERNELKAELERVTKISQVTNTGYPWTKEYDKLLQHANRLAVTLEKVSEWYPDWIAIKSAAKEALAEHEKFKGDK